MNCDHITTDSGDDSGLWWPSVSSHEAFMGLVISVVCYQADIPVIISGYCALQVGCQAASCKLYVNYTPHNRLVGTNL